MAQITRQARLPVLMAVHAGLHGDRGALRRQVHLGGGAVTFGAVVAGAGVGGVAENDVALEAGEALNRRGLCVAGLALGGGGQARAGALHRSGVADHARPFQPGVALMTERCGRGGAGEAGHGQQETSGPRRAQFFLPAPISLACRTLALSSFFWILAISLGSRSLGALACISCTARSHWAMASLILLWLL